SGGRGGYRQSFGSDRFRGAAGCGAGKFVRSAGRQGDARRRASLRRACPFSRERPCSLKSVMRDFRLIPVVLLATAGLLGLKVLGLVFDGGHTLADGGASVGNASEPSPAPAPAVATQSVVMPAREASSPATIPASPSPALASWVQGLFSFSDVTGSSHAA